jgi:magnesium-transporting ATPase (P-type)
MKSKSDPIRLWQIKTFPFDPNRRLSSALVLAQSKANKYSLWSLTKGSPESMSPLYNDSVDEEFDKAYNRRTQELEAQGYRSIALGAQDLSNASHLVDDIFPNGFSGEDEAIQYARAAGTALHRRDFEVQRDNVTLGLEFCGFGCFDAAIRPSSKRVIDELRRGGIKATMLTGDAIDAALAVAWNVGLMDEREVAVLEIESAADGTEGLKWRIVKRKHGKDASFKTLHELARKKSVTLASVKDVLKRQQQGACSIAATGRALELVLGENADPVKQIIADNLFRLSVIARATPSLKKSVVTCFKDRCGQTVLMCGKLIESILSNGTFAQLTKCSSTRQAME